MAKKALGKGLSSIFLEMGTLVPGPGNSQFQEIPISDITPNPFQPRRKISEDEVKELSSSISAQGLLQPILLRKTSSGYQIIAGERRFHAVKLLGQSVIHAQVRENVTDRDMMELSLVENIQRVQLSPVEEAKALMRLVELCGLTHEDLSSKLGRSRSAITNTLRLLKLNPKVQDLVDSGKISAGHARTLLQHSPQNQLRRANKIIEDKSTVREAEALGKNSTKRESYTGNSNLKPWLEKMRYALGTKVNLRGSEKKGKLEIFYFSANELTRISEIIERGGGTPG